MSLPDEEFHRFGEWLQTNPQAGKCPACGNSGWTPGPVVHAIVVENNTIDPARGLRLIPVGCGQCGYTYLLNAYTSKIVRPPSLLETP